jgi:glucose-1-phosphate cytidylyltransferase
LKSLASDGELMSFKHDGFWQPMDKLSDKKYLEELWINNNALWKIW